MRNKTWKKIWLLILLLVWIFGFSFYTNAQSIDGIQIIPELEDEEIEEINEAIDRIGKTGGKVREKYNAAASGMSTSQQIASWIMNRDTLVNYLVYVVKFLSQLWIVVGVVFIMYAWYKYMISVFAWWKTPTSTIKNAIIWVIIVIFSYAIMKILTSLVWLS